jgi:hypothetical protein
MVSNEIPWWAGTFCPRCGREFSIVDPRRNEWQEIGGDLICPYCLTDADIQVIADSLLADAGGPSAIFGTFTPTSRR